MIQTWDINVPNLDVCGLMARDRVHIGNDCPCDDCEDLIIEAWERMTYGGILNEDGPGVYSLENCDTFLERTRLDPR